VNTAITILTPFVLGAVGWFVFEFFGRPVRNFFDLRREIKRRMLLHWEMPLLYTIDPAERADVYNEMKEPRTAFAELGAQLVSFDRSEQIATWFVRRLGFDPGRAGNILRAISIEFGTADEERDKNFRRLDEALKFSIGEGRFYNPYR
jgi:hypothetical protein